MATGDDAGVVKLWDIRQRKVVMIYKENDDFISDFAVFPNNNNMIIAASADERISVFDIRKKKPIKVSDRQEDELLCVATVKVYFFISFSFHSHLLTWKHNIEREKSSCWNSGWRSLNIFLQ